VFKDIDRRHLLGTVSTVRHYLSLFNGKNFALPRKVFFYVTKHLLTDKYLDNVSSKIGIKFHNSIKRMEMLRFALGWDITQRRVVIAHRLFRTDP